MKLNKHLTALIGIFLGLNAILLTVLHKYFLLLLHHTIYYCQEMANTLPIRLPGNLGKVSIVVFFTMFTIITVKLVITWIKALRMKNNLHSSLVYSDKIKQLIEKLNLQNETFVY